MRLSQHSNFTLSCLAAVFMLQPSCLAADPKHAKGTPETIGKQMSARATVDDISSTGPSCYMRDSGPNNPIEACIIGDVLYQMKDGQKKTSIEGEKNCYQLIMSGMFTKLKNQKDIVGQANLTIKIDAERNYQLLSQAIYVPGCAPYHGGDEIPLAAKEFCEQIKAVIETVPLTELTVGNTSVDWMIFEVVIGRDPELFPRYGTRFNGFFKVDKDGNVTDGPRK